jgi:hypothetical protein
MSSVSAVSGTDVMDVLRVIGPEAFFFEVSSLRLLLDKARDSPRPRCSRRRHITSLNGPKLSFRKVVYYLSPFHVLPIKARNGGTLLSARVAKNLVIMPAPEGSWTTRYLVAVGAQRCS